MLRAVALPWNELTQFLQRFNSQRTIGAGEGRSLLLRLVSFSGNSLEIPGDFPDRLMERKLSGLYEFGPFRLDADECLLLRGGEAVALPPQPFDLLLALIAQAGHLLEREKGSGRSPLFITPDAGPDTEPG